MTSTAVILFSRGLVNLAGFAACTGLLVAIHNPGCIGGRVYALLCLIALATVGVILGWLYDQ